MCLDSNVLILALIWGLVGLGGFSGRKTLIYGGDEATNYTYLVSYRDPVSSSLEESRLTHFV